MMYTSFQRNLIIPHTAHKNTSTRQQEMFSTMQVKVSFSHMLTKLSRNAVLPAAKCNVKSCNFHEQNVFFAFIKVISIINKALIFSSTQLKRLIRLIYQSLNCVIFFKGWCHAMSKFFKRPNPTIRVSSP